MPEPPISLSAAHTSKGTNLPIRRIVIHATCGKRGYPAESAAGVARNTARYFAAPSSGGSAHYICDVAGEEHTVPDRKIAWHAPPNDKSIGIEICADGGERYKDFVPYTRQQWLSPQVWPAVQRAARRAAELCDRHDVPKRRLTVAQLKAGEKGICGHVDVSAAFGQTDHSDPGPTFPWDEFMAAVRGDTQQQKEEPVIVVSIGAGKDQQIPAASTKAVDFHAEWADAQQLHTAGGPGISAKADKLWALCDSLVTVAGLGPGGRIELAWTRMTRDGKTVKDDAWRAPYTADLNGVVKVSHPGQFGLNTKTTLHLRVINPNPHPVTVKADTMAKVALVPEG